jgi:hypothetical protein
LTWLSYATSAAPCGSLWIVGWDAFATRFAWKVQCSRSTLVAIFTLYCPLRGVWYTPM